MTICCIPLNIFQIQNFLSAIPFSVVITHWEFNVNTKFKVTQIRHISWNISVPNMFGLHTKSHPFYIKI